MNEEQDKAVALASFRLIETGDPEVARRLVAADFVNREAEDDPEQPDRKRTGPAGLLATGTWLRTAFADLRFDDLDAIAEDGRVVVMAVMAGRHTGPFAGIAPTGRSSRQRQMHLFAVRDGMIVEHRAQRDDLGLLRQLRGRAP